MEFTYSAYKDLIKKVQMKGYQVVNYHNYMTAQKPVILRHDVDFSLEKALKLAEIEYSLGVSSTYFILLSTDFYNMASKKSLDMIAAIIAKGHAIGLHFDEQKYADNADMCIPELIKIEANFMSELIGFEIKSVSMHRPSKNTLEADYKIDGVVNSYSKNFFENFKYVSDSRRVWREKVDDYINAETFDKLHILTHPFWYNDTEETITESLKAFVKNAAYERYVSLNDNIRDLESIIKMDEV